MTPAIYILFGCSLVIGSAAALWLGWMIYYLALNTRELAVAFQDLTLHLKGLPQNLAGIVPATKALAKAFPAHTEQMEQLVMVIREANKTPLETPPPFEENSKDTDWTARIPPSPFDEQ